MIELKDNKNSINNEELVNYKNLENNLNEKDIYISKLNNVLNEQEHKINNYKNEIISIKDNNKKLEISNADLTNEI